MGFQPNTLQGSSSTGYSIVFSPTVGFVEFACRSGEYWVRPKATSSTAAAASGANTAVTSPITSPLTAGWQRLLPGDDVSYGDVQLDPISQCDIWCVSSGDLIVTSH